MSPFHNGPIHSTLMCHPSTSPQSPSYLFSKLVKSLTDFYQLLSLWYLQCLALWETRKDILVITLPKGQLCTYRSLCPTSSRRRESESIALPLDISQVRLVFVPTKKGGGSNPATDDHQRKWWEPEERVTRWWNKEEGPCSCKSCWQWRGNGTGYFILGKEQLR